MFSIPIKASYRFKTFSKRNKVTLRIDYRDESNPINQIGPCEMVVYHKEFSTVGRYGDPIPDMVNDNREPIRSKTRAPWSLRACAAQEY